ncbi:protein SAR DEFICIENT 4 [Neltuma alba]|uniref:protein SAR DEFICIENT 4 n=1 Tax=Neltuma alba TaxID=207710 RepID=UPI0010A3EA3E|nr:protein SAR DEFICIENT 4 [Prosopis alba]XP_028801434.1 protein SAR DEFICIENT 4 [Prosopis alba]
MASLVPISSPVFVSTDTLHSILTHQTLINHFQSYLPKTSTSIQSPMRQSYEVSSSSSLLLMPSWSSSPSFPYIGIKLVTHFPQNTAINLPGVQATYALFSSTTGQPLASMDATDLTLYRTSCVSGLASKYLARPNSQVLVMVGAGAMAPHLIRAHRSAIPSLRKVVIWNRTVEKARILAKKMQENDDGMLQGVSFESSASLDEIIGLGDIVSCATNSEVALVKGEKLKVGAHLDLVGSFKHSMKECDDEAIKRGRVFVDNEAAMMEAGELVGAFERGVIKEEDIVANLVELAAGDKVGRTNSEEITVFKSVGSALVDMLAAQLVYETYTRVSK